MSAALPPHPDRLATTLAQRQAPPGPCALPLDGAADARMPLKLAWQRVRRALAARGTAAAHARLAGLEAPDLLAGTVQDGVARGLLVALEEAESLCRPAPPEPAPEVDPLTLVQGKELRKRKEILVASGGARIRWSRRLGFVFVDREHGDHAEGALIFEDRSDRGTLDGFEPLAGERARLFSPAFLKPVLLEQGKARDLLVLAGSLGRGPCGFPCRIEVEGRKSESCLRLRIDIDNQHQDHRLRLRFLGIPRERISGFGTPEPETVITGGRRFCATTLVRACGRLRVGDLVVAVPDAQCLGKLELEFRLGTPD